MQYNKQNAESNARNGLNGSIKIDELIKRGLLEHLEKGGFIYVDNRTDKSVTFSGGTQNNINVNTGDGDIKQTVTNTESNNGELESLFEKFFAEIPKLSPPDEVEDALDNAEKLKSAIENEDSPRAKKLFGWLPTVVQASSTAVEIFKLIVDNPST